MVPPCVGTAMLVSWLGMLMGSKSKGDICGMCWEGEFCPRGKEALLGG
jgi:hypothetical protein